MKRTLTPEILDHLPPDDPGARCSRRDLRRINRFMGNDAWILRQLKPTMTPMIELGAGDGGLLRMIHARHPQLALAGCDLMPRPDDLPEAIDWLQCDVMELPADAHRGTVVANLFLHHFSDEQLQRLGRRLAGCDGLIMNEPLRARLPVWLGRLAGPFCHPITRHDMRVSIEAGFRCGELPRLLGLGTDEFEITETSTWRGAHRVLALRR